MENKKLKKIIAIAATVVVVIGVTAGIFYWKIASSRVYIEKAQVSAPQISLAPKVGGTLQEVFVNEGDYVKMNAPIARTGNELIKAKSDGLIVSVKSNMGSSYGPGQAVAVMINPVDLRIVGQVQENKGLKDIQVGQDAVFTVDAFGSKKYSGVVDEISPTSREGDIVFNISDKRQEKEFDIKVRFNAAQYLELKNGMSAKLWVYKSL